VNDAVERLVNLAFFLADATEAVTRDRIRTEVKGYPTDQDEDAFLRMFERDKDQLRAAGFTILTDENNRYSVDRSATFATTVDLSADEIAALRAAGGALLADPSFPFGSDLRLALAKIAAGSDSDGPDATIAAASRLADEDPERQGASVADLSAAATASKRVAFGYTNSYGASAPHDVEPYGLFLHDGRWYLVGCDIDRDEVRTYTVSRMSAIVANRSKPATPDFVRPAGFDVGSFVRLPFQYGPPTEEFEAELAIDPSAAWRAERLTAGQGVLTPDGDGFRWRVSARSISRLTRFVVENEPGVRLIGPPHACTALRDGLETVANLHG